MAKIVVMLHGQTLTELNLQPGREYFAGRSANSDILLTNERGISRQHLKIHEVDGGHWAVTLVSKFGGLIYDGHAAEHVQLAENVRFSIPPYEFMYVETEAANLPVPTPKSNEAEEPRPDQKEANMDATVVGASILIPYIRIHNNKTKTEEVLKLEGHTWCVGRHPSCEIVVSDSSISRKHFDISRTENGFFVTDHGSSNGTMVNGERIEPSSPHKILSGDVLTVCHLEFIFELHDGAYENKIQALVDTRPPEFSSVDGEENTDGAIIPPPLTLPAMYGDALHDAPAVLKIPPPEKGPKKYINNGIRKFRTLPKKTQVTIGAATTVLLLAFILSRPSPETKKGEAELGSQNTLAELTPEKKKEASDTFNLARNYYLQRKYVLCLAQLDRLHSMVSFYDNSKELQLLCKQAQELQQIEEERRRKEEARSEVENKVRKIVESCRQAVSPITTTEQLNQCLQEAIQLDPENASILELQTLVAAQENAEREKQEKAQEYIRRKQQGKELFESATANYRQKKIKEALRQYQLFVKGQYPDLKAQEEEAERHIAAIEKSIEDNLREQTSQCQSALERSDLKAAIQACDQVLKESPNYRPAQEIRSKAYSQLKREMKSLYEDSVLEESMGNIDSAKEKWSKILDRSIPQDDYYKKSKEKLKKYGIGM